MQGQQVSLNYNKLEEMLKLKNTSFKFRCLVIDYQNNKTLKNN